MCGLEIHRQLDTGKLHSRHPSELHDLRIEQMPKNWPRVERRLIAASGDSGDIDIAARFEARRHRTFTYVGPPNAGLIEFDEAPPQPLDPDALSACLTLCGMLNASPLPVLQTMRKTVVDGSNTSGFQRTTLVATDGKITVDDVDVGIDVICLEEDSARHPTEHRPSADSAWYTLDRLGIPLVEIATAPDIVSPEHAKLVAAELGAILVDTGKVRRGLGTIRQDLNVSIGAGVRVEIKGCQELNDIPSIIHLEIHRQIHFYKLANELREEIGLAPLPPHRDGDGIADIEGECDVLSRHIPCKSVDVSPLFENSECTILRQVIDEGGQILAAELPHLSGKLGRKGDLVGDLPAPRLGLELAGAARLAGVGGLFHTDEMPSRGVSIGEISEVRNAVNASSTSAVVFVGAKKWQAQLAIEAIVSRARSAWQRLPCEVRGVSADCATRPLRPLPTGARMYPETDLPLQRIDLDLWDLVKLNIPPRSAERISYLSKSHGISEDQAMQIVQRNLYDVFEDGISGAIGHSLGPLSPRAWARMLLEGGSQFCEGFTPSPIFLFTTLHLLDRGVITRDSFPMIGKWIMEGEFEQIDPSLLFEELKSRAESEGLGVLESSVVEETIEKIMDERAEFIAERGMGAIGPLMGEVMARLSGRADGRVVSVLLRAAIERR